MHQPQHVTASSKKDSHQSKGKSISELSGNTNLDLRHLMADQKVRSEFLNLIHQGSQQIKQKEAAKMRNQGLMNKPSHSTEVISHFPFLKDESVIYTVQYNDSPWEICQRFGCSLKYLRDNNPYNPEKNRGFRQKSDQVSEEYYWENKNGTFWNIEPGQKLFVGSRKNQRENKNENQSELFSRIDPVHLGTNIIQRALDPNGLNQGKGTNFCWAAVFLNILWQEYPSEMSNQVIELYYTGRFKFNNVDVSIKKETAKKAGLLSNKWLNENPVDQMLFLALADSPKYKWLVNYLNSDFHLGDQEDATWSGRDFKVATRLFKDAGFDISASGMNYVINPANKIRFTREQAKKYTQKYKHVVLFVNSHLWRKEEMSFDERALNIRYGTHFIILKSVSNLTKDRNKPANFEFWDYGGKDQIYTTHKTKPGLFTEDQFQSAVFGMIGVNKLK